MSSRTDFRFARVVPAPVGYARLKDTEQRSQVLQVGDANMLLFCGEQDRYTAMSLSCAPKDANNFDILCYFFN